jgi:hypothetical protein
MALAVAAVMALDVSKRVGVLVVLVADWTVL